MLQIFCITSAFVYNRTALCTDKEFQPRSNNFLRKSESFAEAVWLDFI